MGAASNSTTNLYVLDPYASAYMAQSNTQKSPTPLTDLINILALLGAFIAMDLIQLMLQNALYDLGKMERRFRRGRRRRFAGLLLQLD